MRFAELTGILGASPERFRGRSRVQLGVPLKRHFWALGPEPCACGVPLKRLFWAQCPVPCALLYSALSPAPPIQLARSRNRSRYSPGVRLAARLNSLRKLDTSL
jgi:hypothetical protein